MVDADNPRAVAGDNAAPDYATMESDRLNEDFANLKKTVTEELALAETMPAVVENDDDAGKVSDLVIRLRSTAKRIETIREGEKEPYLRRGGAVDNFFNALHLKLTRKKKDDLPGIADILHERVDAHNQRKLVEARRVQAEIEKKAAQEAERLRAEQAEKDRLAAVAAKEAQDKLDAAARARNAEKIAEHQQAAAVQQETAAQHTAAADAMAPAILQATTRADEARIDLQRKPADHVRQRTTGGTLNTMKQEPEVKLLDKMKVDLNILRPFLRDADVEFALKAWAKTTGHKTQMEGASIRMVDKTVLRS